MVVVNVKYYLKSGKRQEFYDQINAEGLAEATRNEEGCLVYDYGFDAEDPDCLRLFEVWKDEAAQEFHFTTSQYKRICEIKEVLMDHVDADTF